MKRNIWYLVTGILNIVGAVSSFISALVMIIMGSSMFTMLAEGEIDPSLMTQEDIELMQMMEGFFTAFYYVMLILILAQIVVSIFASIKFIRFSATNEKSSSAVLWVVLTFIFCGILNGILAIVGYINCDENVAPVTVRPAQSSEQQEQVNAVPVYSNLNQLKDLQKLRDENVITEEEYETMRVRILEQSNKDNNNF